MAGKKDDQQERVAGDPALGAPADAGPETRAGMPGDGPPSNKDLGLDLNADSMEAGTGPDAPLPDESSREGAEANEAGERHGDTEYVGGRPASDDPNPGDGPESELARLKRELANRGFDDEDDDPVGEALFAIDELKKDLDAAEKGGNGNGKPAKAAKGAAGHGIGRGRKAGPPKGEAVALPPGTLLDKIDEADEVEIVFSDGEYEITGLPPVPVQGERPWRVTGAGLALQNNEIELRGPGGNLGAFQIAGYALFLDGKLAAYRSRPDVINIGPGQTVRLTDDVIF